MVSDMHHHRSQKKGILRLLKPNEKPPLKPDVTISLSDKDLVGLANGSLNPMKLWEAKRVKVRGDIDRAFKVEKSVPQSHTFRLTPISRTRDMWRLWLTGLVENRILSQERTKLEELRDKKKTARKEVWGERQPVGSSHDAERIIKAKL